MMIIIIIIIIIIINLAHLTASPSVFPSLSLTKQHGIPKEKWHV